MFTLLHPSSEGRRGGFTLIELLTVMAIIAILASLVLGVLSWAQNKAARERTTTEIQGMQSALEQYKTDNAVYPSNSDSDALDARTVLKPTTAYQKASLFLYGCISGDYDPMNPTAATNYDGELNGNENAKAAYFKFRQDSLGRADLTKPASAGNKVTYLMDGFANSYGYSTAYQAWVTAGSKPPQKGVNPTYDLWSTGGDIKGAGNFDTASAKWLKNW